jgi:hypothetical protein
MTLYWLCALIFIFILSSRGARVKWSMIDEKKERVSKKSKTVIPRPLLVYRNEKKRTVIGMMNRREVNFVETHYVGPKDTPSDSVLLETFDPDTLNPLLEASLEHKTRSLNRE